MIHEWHREKNDQDLNHYWIDSRDGTYYIEPIQLMNKPGETEGWFVSDQEAGAEYKGDRAHKTLKAAKAAIEATIPDPYRANQEAIDRLDTEYKRLHPMRGRIYDRHLHRAKEEPKHYRMAYDWLTARLDTIESEITFQIGFALNSELRKGRDHHQHINYRIGYGANPKAYYALWSRDGGFLPNASANRWEENSITIDFRNRQSGKRIGYIKIRPEPFCEGGTWSRRQTSTIRIKKTTESYQERTVHFSLRDIYRLIDLTTTKRNACSARIEYLLKKSEATTPALEGLKNRMPDHLEMRTTGTTYGTRILIGREGFSDYSDPHIQIGMNSDGKIINMTTEIKGRDLDPSILDAMMAHIQ